MWWGEWMLHRSSQLQRWREDFWKRCYPCSPLTLLLSAGERSKGLLSLDSIFKRVPFLSYSESGFCLAHPGESRYLLGTLLLPKFLIGSPWILPSSSFRSKAMSSTKSITSPQRKMTWTPTTLTYGLEGICTLSSAMSVYSLHSVSDRFPRQKSKGRSLGFGSSAFPLLKLFAVGCKLHFTMFVN